MTLDSFKLAGTLQVLFAPTPTILTPEFCVFVSPTLIEFTNVFFVVLLPLAQVLTSALSILGQPLLTDFQVMLLVLLIPTLLIQSFTGFAPWPSAVLTSFISMELSEEFPFLALGAAFP